MPVGHDRQDRDISASDVETSAAYLMLVSVKKNPAEQANAIDGEGVVGVSVGEAVVCIGSVG